MTNIEYYENISAVTFSDLNSEGTFFEDVLNAVAKVNINIDMISLTPPKSDKFSFGFSFNDSDMVRLLSVMKEITSVHNTTPLVNNGGVKLVITSGDMENQSGFAAKVFNAVNKVKAQLLLVTTSVDEISLLVNESSFEDLLKLLNETL